MTEVAMPQEAQVTEHGIPIRNVWHMLLYTWGHAKKLERWRGEVEAAPSLDGLLASVLARLVEQRLRIGLGREYVAVNQRLKGIRGRVDFNRSLLDRTFERGEAHCRYESYEADAPRNRVIQSTLALLVTLGDFGHEGNEARQLRHRLRQLVRDMDGIQSVAVSLNTIRQVHLSRNDGDYRLMLAICEYLLQKMMPTENLGRSPALGLNRDEFTLYRLFEQFVAAFYKIHLGGWEISPQSWLNWPVETEVPRLPKLIPDLILKSNADGRIVVLDTKFTAASLTGNQGGKNTYDSGHLYQLYAYLRTQEDTTAEHGRARGILLYPTARFDLSDKFNVQGHEFAIETVDLAAPWTQIEQRLLAIIR